MAEDNIAIISASGETGGPPSDLGNSTPVVVEKINAPPKAEVTPPPPAPKGEAPPKAAVTPPAPKVETPPKTLATEPAPKEGDEKIPTPAEWPDDWREKMAGNDAKELARLKRFNSPLDMKNAYRALEQRLSSGEYKKALPNNATPEEVTEYRKSNGIPDKPEDYDVSLGNGFVWGEADKPVLDDFTKFAHERNMPGEVVKSALEWYTHQQQVLADQTAERDERERINGGEALRAEWGNGFKGNLAANRTLFEGHVVETPKGEKVPAFDVLMSARASDGRLLGNIPDVVKIFSSISRELNPFATLVPENGGTPIKSAEARLGEINAMMANRQGPYWKGPQSAVLQQEWRDLHDAIEKSKGRAA